MHLRAAGTPYSPYVCEAIQHVRPENHCTREGSTTLKNTLTFDGNMMQPNPFDHHYSSHSQYQEDYSIPDDDLRSVSSANSGDECMTSNNMIDEARKSFGDSAFGSTPNDTVYDDQVASETSNWTTVSKNKNQAAAKKHKAAPSIDVDAIHKATLQNPAYCALSESNLEQIADNTRQQTKIGASSHIKHGSHDLRQGGMTAADWNPVMTRSAPPHVSKEKHTLNLGRDDTTSDDMSDTSTSSTKGRVLLTTLSAEEDYEFGDSSNVNNSGGNDTSNDDLQSCNASVQSQRSSHPRDRSIKITKPLTVRLATVPPQFTGSTNTRSSSNNQKPRLNNDLKSFQTIQYHQNPHLQRFIHIEPS